MAETYVEHIPSIRTCQYKSGVFQYENNKIDISPGKCKNVMHTSSTKSSLMIRRSYWVFKNNSKCSNREVTNYPRSATYDSYYCHFRQVYYQITH